MKNKLLALLILISTSLSFTIKCIELSELPDDSLFEIFSRVILVNPQLSKLERLKAGMPDLKSCFPLSRKINKVIAERILDISPEDATQLLFDCLEEDRESPQSIELLSFLIKIGDVNARDGEGNTPIIKLVTGEIPPCNTRFNFPTVADVSSIAPTLKLLLEHGAATSVKNAKGKTVFDFLEDDPKNFIIQQLKKITEKKG